MFNTEEGFFDRHLKLGRKQSDKSVLMNLRFAAIVASAPFSESHEGYNNTPSSNNHHVDPRPPSIPIAIPADLHIPSDIQISSDMLPIIMPIARPVPTRNPPKWPFAMVQSQWHVPNATEMNITHELVTAMSPVYLYNSIVLDDRYCTFHNMQLWALNT